MTQFYEVLAHLPRNCVFDNYRHLSFDKLFYSVRGVIDRNSDFVSYLDVNDALTFDILVEINSRRSSSHTWHLKIEVEDMFSWLNSVKLGQDVSFPDEFILILVGLITLGTLRHVLNLFLCV